MQVKSEIAPFSQRRLQSRERRGGFQGRRTVESETYHQNKIHKTDEQAHDQQFQRQTRSKDKRDRQTKEAVNVEANRQIKKDTYHAILDESRSNNIMQGVAPDNRGSSNKDDFSLFPNSLNSASHKNQYKEIYKSSTHSNLELHLKMSSDQYRRTITRSRKSTDSDDNTTDLDEKKLRSHCYTCNKDFGSSPVLLSHLKIHVTMPIILISKVKQPNIVKNSPKLESPNEGSLKIRLKLSGSPENKSFRVVENNEEKNSQIGTIRVLRADEIKKSDSPPPVRMLEEMKIPESALEDIKPILNSVGDKIYDSPVIDGLDQFNEFTRENSDELLQKLLNCNEVIEPPSSNEPEWQTSNEFISIDRLGCFCTVCHMNFADNIMLFDHKRLTGHDYHEEMRRPPQLQQMHHPAQFSHRVGYPGPHHTNSGFPSLYGSDGSHSQHSYTQSNCFQQQGYQAMPYGMMPQQRRAPPPLYRVPGPTSQHQQLLQRPIQRPYAYHANYPMQRPSEFMKARLQKNPNSLENSSSAPVILGQQTAVRPRFLSPPNNFSIRPQEPKLVINQSTVQNRLSNSQPSRPLQRPIGPLSRIQQLQKRQLPPAKQESTLDIKDSSGSNGPIIKKIRLIDERNSPLPVIKSVIGGAVQLRSESNLVKPKDTSSPLQVNEQTNLNKLTVEPKKNPKEVANILANRGIIVTRNSGKPIEATESNTCSEKTSATQEAVQKLQMNNSVSIISKKKTESIVLEEEDDVKIRCSQKDCSEKFISSEHLNRHLVHDHNLFEKLNPTAPAPAPVSLINGNLDQQAKTVQVTAFKCKVCPALFSSQTGLHDHQARAHRMFNSPSEELGIPIVDLSNEQTKRKLASLGITSYIPLGTRSSNNMYGLPVVSVRGAPNTALHNLLGLGANSILSLGPLKQIINNNPGPAGNTPN